MTTPISPDTPALPFPATKRAHGRSLSDFVPLRPAEKQLLDCCASGKVATICKTVPTDNSDPKKIIRAGFLRFLLLGGDEQAPVHEEGIKLHGAKIEGPLELMGCYVPYGMRLSMCNFDESIYVLHAHIAGTLILSGSHLSQKLLADGLRCDNGVFLRDGFRSADGVRLINAQIGGDLNCAGAQLAPDKKGRALTADGIVVAGSVHLRCGFKTTGIVRLPGARIGGDLDCHEGDFSARSAALELQSTTIQTAKLHDFVGPTRIYASAAQIDELSDDRSAWAKGSTLNGLVYKSLGGKAPTDAAMRIRWLRLQCDEDLGEDEAKQGFRPQPWKQLQKVLREMGHDADAREVGVAYEDQLRKADRIGQIADAGKAKNILPVMRRRFLRALHWLFGFLAGYGYHPLRLFMSLVWVWLFCGVIYWWLAYAPHSAIGPTDPLVFQNSAYQACTTENNGNWMLCRQLPAEYTTFSPLAYSLDVLLPLVDLGQEKRWGPLVPTPARHFCVELLSLSRPHWVRLFNWFQILYGWMASLLFVAIVSGMSRRSEMD